MRFWIKFLLTELALVNIALHKPAGHSSQYTNHPASLAVDGHPTSRATAIGGDLSYPVPYGISGRDGQFTHTRTVSNSWWKVDTQKLHTVYRVELFLRKKFCMWFTQHLFSYINAYYKIEVFTCKIHPKGQLSFS